MKKLALIMAVLTASMLTACGSEKPVAEAPVEVVEEQKEVVEEQPEVVEEVVEEEAKCEHDFIEANYQEPKTCSICGETEGEKLEAYKEKEASNSKHVLSEDAGKVIDMEVVCRNDSSKTSVLKVWMENVNRFDSDEKHQAQEGYEWISADVYWACGDDNSAYGVGIGNVYDDYYIENDFEGDTYTANWHGEDFDKCKQEEEEIVYERGKDLSDKFGWSDCTLCGIRHFFLIPKDYDGVTVGLADYNAYVVNESFDDCSIVEFRLK